MPHPHVNLSNVEVFLKKLNREILEIAIEEEGSLSTSHEKRNISYFCKISFILGKIFKYWIGAIESLSLKVDDFTLVTLPFFCKKFH